MRDQLFRLFDVNGYDGFKKVTEGYGMIPLRKEEINTVMHFFDIDCILVGRMF